MAAPDVLDYAPPAVREATTLQKISWAMCDWANSGYGLIVVGPVFSPYFINALLPRLPGTDDHGLQFAGVTMPGAAVM